MPLVTQQNNDATTFLFSEYLMKTGHSSHSVVVEIILQIEENISLWYVT